MGGALRLELPLVAAVLEAMLELDGLFGASGLAGGDLGRGGLWGVGRTVG